MLEQILDHFPPHVHHLSLVHDPDHILADEGLLAELGRRDFVVILAQDPAQLLAEVSQVTGPEQALVIVTEQSLNELPYSLWQQGHPLSLALHTFFPNLVYPVLQSLSPHQRWQLSQVALPYKPRGRQGSVDFLLSRLFGVAWPALATPAGLVAWLNQYHQGQPMPRLLAERWLSRAAASNPLYGEWPLAEWLHDRAAFQRFMSEEWQGYIARQTGQALGEPRVTYRLAFEADEQLQDGLPQLLRRGTVQPVTLPDASPLPAWAQVGVRASAADFAQQRAADLLSLLAEQAANLAAARWQQWQEMAMTWAELTAWRYHPQRYLRPEQQAAVVHWQDVLDGAFAAWLGSGYGALAGQILPQPHHLFHVPHWLAYERRRQGVAGRVALLVLDGLSLAAWWLLARAWGERQPGWQWQSQLLLAQVPSLTAVSRQALLSGKRPVEFAGSLTHNRYEGRQWAAFWEREGIPAQACAYERLRLEGDEWPDVGGGGRVQALCLIYNDIDEMVHGASQGLTDVHASLQAWLQGEVCQRLEGVLAELLGQGYAVYLTSDHGHTEAWGMGQPREGVTVQSRSMRARLYDDLNSALAVQADFPQTLLWASQRLLPADSWVLLPLTEKGRRLAFAPQGQRVVTHGGLSLDEMVVPLVRLTQRREDAKV